MFQRSADATTDADASSSTSTEDETNADSPNDSQPPHSDAEHRMRHHRFMRQQLQVIEVAQRQMRHQISTLQRDHLATRMQTVEQEQRRLADGAFNVSRQVASLDRLHGSMLALLEDIESVQATVDKSVPEIRREIAKVEFSAAQLAAEQNILREEEHNAAKSIQAIAQSVSTLQDERELAKAMHTQLQQLQRDVAGIKLASNVHRDIAHRRLEKVSLGMVWTVDQRQRSHIRINHTRCLV